MREGRVDVCLTILLPASGIEATIDPGIVSVQSHQNQPNNPAVAIPHGQSTHMNKKNIHITAAPEGGWQGKREGATRPSFRTDKKKDAIDKGRSISQKEHGELIIHGKDGKIQSRDSHGNDPASRKG